MKAFNITIRIGMLAVVLLCFVGVSAQTKKKVNRVRKSTPTTVKKQVPAKDAPAVSRSEIDAQMELMRLDEMSREADRPIMEGVSERVVAPSDVEVLPPPPPSQDSGPMILKEVNNKVFDVVEVQPSFPGGVSALMAWLGENIQYPKVAEENGIQGRVVVSFVVEKDGSVSDVKVTRGVDPSLDKEALRVVSSMPNWNPGMQDGEPVRVKYNLPLTFKLDNPKPKE